MIVLVAHGTADPEGLDTIEALRVAVAGRVTDEVRLAYVDVCEPRLSTALQGSAGATIVPLFLAHGYHVEVDIPTAATAFDALVTAHLGSSGVVAAVVADRVRDVSATPEAIVVLGAGSSRAAARAEVAGGAAELSGLSGVPVTTGFLSGPGPSADDVLARAVAEHGHEVVVAPWLLAPGHFARKASTLAAAHGLAVTPPLGTHPDLVARIVELIRASVARSHS